MKNVWMDENATNLEVNCNGLLDSFFCCYQVTCKAKAGFDSIHHLEQGPTAYTYGARANLIQRKLISR